MQTFSVRISYGGDETRHITTKAKTIGEALKKHSETMFTIEDFLS